MKSPVWTDDDALLLRKTCDEEIILWKTTKDLLDCTPHDLFPQGIRAANDSVKGLYSIKENRYIKNDAYITPSFCKAFSEILSLECLNKNIKLVKYVLYAALKARCGLKTPKSKVEMPNLNKTFGPWANFLVKSKGISISSTGEILVDLQFLSCLEEAVNASTEIVEEIGDWNHLLCVDLQNIVKAHDIWTERQSIPCRRIIAIPQDALARMTIEKKRQLKSKFSLWKKEWILERRRKNIQEIEEIERKIIELETRRLEIATKKWQSLG